MKTVAPNPSVPSVASPLRWPLTAQACDSQFNVSQGDAETAANVAEMEAEQALVAANRELITRCLLNIANTLYFTNGLGDQIPR